MDIPTDVWTDVWTYVRMENLPILQDYRCPATAQLEPKNCIKRGKGTANHMMPLGDWLGMKSCSMGRFSIHPSNHPLVCLFPSPKEAEGYPARAKGQPARAEGQPTTPEGKPAMPVGEPARFEGQPTRFKHQPVRSEG